MRARLTIAFIFALGFLTACGGSGSGGGTHAASEAACVGADCGRDTTVPTAPLACGGENATTCPQGYRCVDDPDGCDPVNGASCAATCVLGEELPRCGRPGDAPCADGSVCVDNAGDTCAGGPAIDCPGICRPKAVGDCSTDADCPAPAQAACSICADGSVNCPHVKCDNGQCMLDSNPCRGPEGCGGISGTPCAPGFRCVDDPADKCAAATSAADCRGICVPEEKPVECNGIAGIACPPGLECVDDPNDSCDAQHGGADCPGVCRPSTGAQCTTDADCPALRAPCSVCADGSETCSRSFCGNGVCTVAIPSCPTPPPVLCGDAAGGGCKPGDVCVLDPNSGCDPATGACKGTCTPVNEPRRCGGLLGATCPDGYTCVDDRRDDCTPEVGGADCPGVCEVSPAPQCHADSECVSVQAPCSLCPDGSYACPRAECKAGTCTTVFGACTGPGFCGGIAGFPCPPGSTCVDDPSDTCDPKQGGADCGGVCVREEAPPQCGGLTGKPCAAGFECVDDPRDDCNPDAGGADCPGVCKSSLGSNCASDADCPVIGAPCRLCADGTAACPRSFCTTGQCQAEFPTCKDQP